MGLFQGGNSHGACYMNVVLSGTGIYIPPDFITTDELVTTYNTYATNYNQKFKKEISSGLHKTMEKSCADFVIKASGIYKRHVIDRAGILNPDILHPILPHRGDDELSIQCEMAVYAAKEALKNANKTPQNIDAVIVACSNTQRPYPSIAMEVQATLGCKGFACDLNVACSSASFGINIAQSLILSHAAKCVLMVNPEIYTGHLNFRDRTSHFIFGDACSAAILEDQRSCSAEHPYNIISGKLETKFSNNIRNNFGFLNRCEQNHAEVEDKLFVQQGRMVRQDVVPFTIDHVNHHLATCSIKSNKLKRLWLHQANIQMNNDIARGIFGRKASQFELPIILDEYGNTGASGVMIAFHKFHNDLNKGDIGLLCSFGAGYGVGSILLEKWG